MAATVHQFRGNAQGRGQMGVGFAQRVQRNDQSARGRAGNAAHHIGGDRNRHERRAGNRQKSVADHGERRQCRDHGAETHQAGRVECRQHGGVGAGIKRRAQRCRRLRKVNTRTSEAIASAVTTDQTPLTAASEVSPNRGSARKPVLTRGSTNRPMTRLTASTMRIGIVASTKGGNCSLRWPCVNSAGSKLSAFVARSRTNCSSAVACVLSL